MLTETSPDLDLHGGAEAPKVESGLTSIRRDEIPEGHPVRQFASLFDEFSYSKLLPHEKDLHEAAHALKILQWAKHVEPVELSNSVDFKIIRQGAKSESLVRRQYNDEWIRDAIDPEFVRARYQELIAASVLRRPMFSKGAAPTKARAFLRLLRGVFPVFADNRARLRLFVIEAEPYAVVD